MYNCKILLDSVSETGKRLTTFEITYPRIIHSEFMTHRMFSRNAASSRAIPFKKMLEMVKENPFVPEQFPINGKGMQPNSYIYGNSDVYIEASKQWLHARDSAINEAEMLYGCLDKFADINHVGTNIHKQIVNRLLEPFLWYTCLVTATEFDNFFKLRCDENAQYEIRIIANLMYEAYHSNLINYKAAAHHSISPIQKLKIGEWHCPLISEEDNILILNYMNANPPKEMEGVQATYNLVKEDVLDELQKIKKKISVARCARVSYLTHDGKRDIEKDLELFERLRTSGHWSPFEHVATPYFQFHEPQYNDIPSLSLEGQIQWDETKTCVNKRSGNFIGWKQYRKEFQDENCTNFRKEN